MDEITKLNLLKEVKAHLRYAKSNPKAWYSYGVGGRYYVSNDTMWESFFPSETEISHTYHVFRTGFITSFHIPEDKDSGTGTAYSGFLEVHPLNPEDDYVRHDGSTMNHEDYDKYFAVDITLRGVVVDKYGKKRLDKHGQPITQWHMFRTVMLNEELSRYHIVSTSITEENAVGILLYNSSEVTVYRERGLLGMDWVE